MRQTALSALSYPHWVQMISLLEQGTQSYVTLINTIVFTLSLEKNIFTLTAQGTRESQEVPRWALSTHTHSCTPFLSSSLHVSLCLLSFSLSLFVSLCLGLCLFLSLLFVPLKVVQAELHPFMIYFCVLLTFSLYTAAFFSFLLFIPSFHIFHTNLCKAYQDIGLYLDGSTVVVCNTIPVRALIHSEWYVFSTCFWI